MLLVNISVCILYTTGSEGTLGIITKIAIQMKPLPRSVHVALLKVQSFAAVPAVLKSIRQEINEIVSAIEFIDTSSVRVVHADNPTLTDRLSSSDILPSPTTAASSAGSDKDDMTAPDEVGCDKSGIAGEALLLLECSGGSVESDKARYAYTVCIQNYDCM